MTKRRRRRHPLIPEPAEPTGEELFQVALGDREILREYDAGTIALATLQPRTKPHTPPKEEAPVSYPSKSTEFVADPELGRGHIMCARPGCGAGPFESGQAMAAHDRVHQDATCPYCGRTMPSNAIGNHKRVCNLNPERNPINTIECPDCGKKMKSTSLRKHQATACRKATLRRELSNHRAVPPKGALDLDGLGTLVQDQTTETLEVEVLALLDLLFPNGIRVECLPLVDQWRQVTVNLIRTSRGQ